MRRAAAYLVVATALSCGSGCEPLDKLEDGAGGSDAQPGDGGSWVPEEGSSTHDGSVNSDAGMDATATDGIGSDAQVEPDGPGFPGNDACPGLDAAEPDGDQALACAGPAVQIAGIPFNASTIVTTDTCGPPLTPIDGTNNGNELPTATEAAVLYGSGSPGLPNNAHFELDGSVPCVQLAWTDATNGLNSIVLPFDTPSGTQTTAKISLPQSQQAQYQRLQIYATGGNAGSTPLAVSYGLTYAGGSPSTSLGTIDVPDWCFPTGSPIILASAPRVNGHSADNAFESEACSIYVINLPVDSNRTLTEISFSFGASSGYFVLYGATAW